MTTSLRWSLALTLAAVLGGCNVPSATPQGAFRDYREAVARKDWNATLAALTPAARDKVVGGLLAAVATASVLNKEAADVLKKHDINRGDLVTNLVSGAMAKLTQPSEAIGEGVRRSVETIADKPAFVGDAAGWLETNNPEVADKFMVAAAAQLTDVQIDGDTA
ncbi:MAG: hypothetical protein HQ582_34215, partial [Planctomycetes bacterium]|nr:hypothetical protein [Planctomycetota bacterium]